MDCIRKSNYVHSEVLLGRINRNNFTLFFYFHIPVSKSCFTCHSTNLKFLGICFHNLLKYSLLFDPKNDPK